MIPSHQKVLQAFKKLDRQGLLVDVPVLRAIAKTLNLEQDLYLKRHGVKNTSELKKLATKEVDRRYPDWPRTARGPSFSAEVIEAFHPLEEPILDFCAASRAKRNASIISKVADTAQSGGGRIYPEHVVRPDLGRV